MKKSLFALFSGFMLSTFVSTALLFPQILTRSEPGDGSETDWPAWLGPNRNGISTEKILKTWPEGGLQDIWRKPIGAGFSGITVADNRLYTMEDEGKSEFAICLNPENGKEIWRVRTDKHYVERQGGDGPRTTPMVSGSMVYVQSAYGKLYALNTKDGAVIWKHDLQKEYGGRMPTWGYSGTPLLLDGMLLTEAGGSNGRSLVAFDQKSGALIWNSQNDVTGYSSPVVTTVGGNKQVLFFTGSKLMSVSPKDGHLYWEFPWTTSYDANAATPVILPGDRVFISSNYGKGAVLLSMKADGKKVSASEIWRIRNMRNHMSTSIYLDGHIYGFDNATLKCIDAATGTDKWKKRGFGKGTLIYADGHFIVLAENGELALVKANPHQYIEVANSGRVVRGRSWTVPTLANGRLYIRNLREIVCLDISDSSL
ncbi:MAG: PQQ-binding-like beta-propeller repeat protein [Planctomycetota bacterium]|jgi:outer membrane protein assembly factor BamB